MTQVMPWDLGIEQLQNIPSPDASESEAQNKQLVWDESGQVGVHCKRPSQAIWGLNSFQRRSS